MSDTEILATPSVVRTVVVDGKPYDFYREYLRNDFWYSCAYCSISEIEASGYSFQIDHYKPQSVGGSDVHYYSNLMWSCHKCNSNKSDHWENLEQRGAGYRFLRPDQDDLVFHYKVIGSILVPLTVPAEYTVEILNLNSAAMRSIRALRARMSLSRAALIEGLQAMRALRIDQIPRALRAKFSDVRNDLQRDANAVASGSEVLLLIKALNHSCLIDPDPDQVEQKKRRREYLARMGNLTS